MSKSRENLQARPREGAAQGGGGAGAPAISLPKGGGAIRGIGEKFAANPVNGTGSMTVPIAVSQGRSGFAPQLALSYDSGAGSGPFGFGWGLSLPSITRKTDKGLPQYRDAEESDTFVLSGAEDLVPVLSEPGGGSRRPRAEERPLGGRSYRVEQYRPRVEGLFARVERWTDAQTGAAHWRSISRDNVTTVYGRGNNSRVYDPADPDADNPQRVFRWLICESYDDRGNAVVYEYKPEDSAGVDAAQAHERNRTAASRAANRYLKRVRYGNRVSRLVEPDLSRAAWMFEVVFDYGEHGGEAPTPAAERPWLCRHDPFSSYRAGFEVRTYRLCQRVLMFHHFPGEEGVGADCLVRSTEFAYRDDGGAPDGRRRGHPVASLIASVTQSGYQRRAGGGYEKGSLPPLEFEYSRAEIHEELRDVAASSVENLPAGLDGSTYRWVDLDGEGLSGVLTEQASAWFYKPNLGGGRLGPLEAVESKPSLAHLGGGRQQLLDLGGDGQLDLVSFGGPAPGFFERTREGRWADFTPFARLPDIDWDDPNLRFVDLNGDGHADLLITEADAFTWYPSLAESGFGPAARVSSPAEEERGPRLVFSDGEESVYLADMCGDGLPDLVRVRNGEVCYWPNVGYGRFGARVTMDDSPWFDTREQFDRRRVRLADIDGSGTNDIIYLGPDGIRLYFNQSGNRFGVPRRLGQFPRADDLTNVAALDLLGNGTACLVWSSPLPGDARAPLRYIDLMGGQKPHLLVKVVNNLGAETAVRYAPSTRFYLADKAAGRPWVTRLPFPVHVVERVETSDRVSRNRFTARYAYHHGHFDGEEREFRGFGMVEQWDTEESAALAADGELSGATNLDESSHVPPVLTKTWFHTGSHPGAHGVSGQFAREYYREFEAAGAHAADAEARLGSMLLEDTILPDSVRLADGRRAPHDLTGDEELEACRALKGSVLRQEVYALDGPGAAARPYVVTECNYTVELVQPRGVNRHAVFFTHPRETVEFHYERKLYTVGARELPDPRVGHTLTLDADEFGNVLESVYVGYGRRHEEGDPAFENADREKQRRPLVTHTVNRYTEPVRQADAYRAPLPCETCTYELVNVAPDAPAPPGGPGGGPPAVTRLFDFAGMARKAAEAGDGDHDLTYEETVPRGEHAAAPHRRLIEHTRTLYRDDDLSAPLPLGRCGPRGLLFESYRLALTPGTISRVYRRGLGATVENLLPDVPGVLGGRGRYLRSTDHRALGLFPAGDPDDHWWIPSGRIFYSPEAGHSAAEEFEHARRHFFLSRRFRDTFGQTTTVTYDRYDLLLQETRDPLGNRITAGTRDGAGLLVAGGNDYRVLQPTLLTDQNRNRAAVAFDALGVVAGTAMMGKPEEALGDSLEGFEPNPAPADVAAYFETPLPTETGGGGAHELLRGATTRFVYDLFAYLRTRGDAQPQPAAVCTLSRETHQADLNAGERPRLRHSFSYSDGFGREIQKKVQAEPGPLAEGGAEVKPRWVGSGWTVFNNKGNPVRQFEPFFSRTHRFEFARAAGVSSLLFYDPLGRVSAILHPNHTYEKTVYEPWRQETWDVNDTAARTDPQNDPDVGGFFRRIPEAEYLPTWRAQREAAGADARERSAAAKAVAHAGTPAVAHFDPLGRTFLSVTHNRFESDGEVKEERYATRLDLDIEGNQRGVTDARGRVVVRSDYDMLGTRIRQASMEAGVRWTLGNAAGNPVLVWDSLGRAGRTEYDALRRPTEFYVREGSDAEALVERHVYGETRPDPEAANLRGKPYQVFDGAGVVTNEAYDFKGNLLRGTRRFAEEYKAVLDWSSTVALQAAAYHSSTTYDALSRPVTATGPDGTVTRPVYNEAGLLERVGANVRGESALTPFVRNLDYNARGQRVLAEFGNDAQTRYQYDPLTFRLKRLYTSRGAAFPEDCPDPAAAPCGVQNLRYTYDPAGNITYVRDDAQQKVYFGNVCVEPDAEYTYDAAYRLVAASGREHLGLTTAGSVSPPTPPGPGDAPRVGLPHRNDCKAVGRYRQQYVYDGAGNLKEVRHTRTDASHAGWTRLYDYEEASLLESADRSNRLTRTRVGGSAETYAYDAHGNMTFMTHLPLLSWDFRDRLRATSRQSVGGGGGTPETTYYVYDSLGERVRKVTEGAAAPRATPTRKAERLYFGGHEIYREYDSDGTTVTLERETLHVMDDKQRVALVETRTAGDDGSPPRLVRYQFGNHLGSASLELGADRQVISYEEFYPFGSTSFQSAAAALGAAAKRYRYTAKERDEENDLYYHGARYYAPWLGRWTACDPKGLADGVNLYRYVSNNPIILRDPTGTEGVYDEAAGVCLPEYPVCSPRNPAGLTSVPTANSVRTVTRDAPRPARPSSGGRGAAAAPQNSAQPQQRNFFSRGGSTLLTGGLMLAGGLFIIGTAGAGTPLLLLLGGAMATGGGVMGTTVGATQLALSYTGQTTAAQDQELRHATSTTMALSSPGGLTGGVTGLAMTGSERGLERGALVGGVAESGYGFVRAGAGMLRGGRITELSSDAALHGDAAAMQASGTIPRGTQVLSSHGAPGVVQVAGTYVPVTELGPMVTAANPGRVTILACEVAQDANSMQQLANAVRRPVTGYTQVVGATDYTQVIAFTPQGGQLVPSGLANAVTFSPSMPALLGEPLRSTAQIAAGAQAQQGR